MYTPSGTKMEWLGELPLFKSDLNKRCRAKMGPLFESTCAIIEVRLVPLFGTHQTISGRLEQMYLPSDLRLEWPGEGPLFELDLNKCQGQKCGHCSSHCQGHYLCQASQVS